MTVLPKLEAAARTDIGRARRSNQDTFGVDDELGLYVVCDGMGGAAGGEVASRIAVETFLDVARHELFSLHDANAECTRCSLLRAAAAANRAVLARARFDIALRGMGTTLVAARVSGHAVTVLNVGDSRAYHFGPNGSARLTPTQITVDHSYLAEQVRRGRLTETQAARTGLQSVITRAIGADQDVTPDLYDSTLHCGESILLCSDGLTRHVTADDLAALVAEFTNDSADAACGSMIRLANMRGGADNITCLLLRANPA